MTSPSAPAASPISRTINVDKLPSSGLAQTITADADEREALAKAHDLVSVDTFSATLDMRRWHRHGVRISGAIKADIVQQCVISLEPVPAQIDAEIDALFVPEGSPLAQGVDDAGASDLVIDPEGPDLPEPFNPPHLDIGAVAEEFFALAIDPYPHAPGAGPLAQSEDGAADDDADSPFAALKALRDQG